MLVQGTAHLEKLCGLFERATDPIELVSPWITGPALSKLLDAAPARVPIHITFSWPTEDDRPENLPLDAIEKAYLQRSRELNPLCS
jgi:hypothetical protein